MKTTQTIYNIIYLKSIVCGGGMEESSKTYDKLNTAIINTPMSLQQQIKYGCWKKIA